MHMFVLCITVLLAAKLSDRWIVILSLCFNSSMPGQQGNKWLLAMPRSNLISGDILHYSNFIILWISSWGVVAVMQFTLTSSHSVIGFNLLSTGLQVHSPPVINYPSQNHTIYMYTVKYLLRTSIDIPM